MPLQRHSSAGAILLQHQTEEEPCKLCLRKVVSSSSLSGPSVHEGIEAAEVVMKVKREERSDPALIFCNQEPVCLCAAQKFCGESESDGGGIFCPHEVGVAPSTRWSVPPSAISA